MSTFSGVPAGPAHGDAVENFMICTPSRPPPPVASGPLRPPAARSARPRPALPARGPLCPPAARSARLRAAPPACEPEAPLRVALGGKFVRCLDEYDRIGG